MYESLTSGRRKSAFDLKSDCSYFVTYPDNKGHKLHEGIISLSGQSGQPDQKQGHQLMIHNLYTYIIESVAPDLRRISGS